MSSAPASPGSPLPRSMRGARSSADLEPLLGSTGAGPGPVFEARNRPSPSWRSQLVKALMALVGVGVVLAGLSYWYGKSKDPFGWSPCDQDSSMFCGTLAVPTDYDDPSVGKTYLAMTKIPARKHPRKGSVLINYGGPGAEGYQSSFFKGKEKLARYAPSYDIISWDPRGIGRTVPTVNCHGNDAASKLALANTVHETTFDVPPDPFTTTGRAHLVAQQREAAQLMEMQGRLCGKVMGAEVMKYMGTTTLIRDMERINALLEGSEADINLISGSYGVIVAAYLVNMLPQKVGKVLTWGAPNVDMWVNQHYENYNQLEALLADSEITYDWFLGDCFALGQECPLYEKGDSSANDIKARIDTFLNDLYHKPQSLPFAERPGLLHSGHIRAHLFERLQTSDRWPAFAQDLADAMHGNGTWIRNIRASPGSVKDIGQPDLQRLAVSCADAPPYKANESWPTPEQTVDRLLQIVKNVTPRFGATVNLLEQHGGCQYWPQSKKPVPRFTGPWNANIKNPILIASNSHDPITPRREGKALAEGFGDKARHIVNPVPGHSYLIEPVSTFLEAVVDYFENGKLPPLGETVYAAEGRNYLRPLQKGQL